MRCSFNDVVDLDYIENVAENSNVAPVTKLVIAMVSQN